LKTFSTTIEPPSRKPNCSPIMVTTGMSALRMPCLITTRTSSSPFARAVRMKSSPRISTNEERVKRAMIAATAAPSVIDGRT
jgi:hypothetical protein